MNNSPRLQRTFRESYMKTLRDAVVTGDALPLYAADTFALDAAGIQPLARVVEPQGLAERMQGLEDDDFAAARTIYEAYSTLSPLVASNEAFWAYLTHTSLFAYTQRRWPNVMNQTATPDYILEHWFIGTNRILRNAAAAGWWTIHNTITPERKDPYELSAIMYKNYALRTNTLGTSLVIRHREAMIGILDYLRDHPKITEQYFEARSLFIYKYFNRLGAVKQLAYLPREYFRQTLEGLHDRILSVTTREQPTHDETLYNY